MNAILIHLTMTICSLQVFSQHSSFATPFETPIKSAPQDERGNFAIRYDAQARRAG